MIIMPTSCCVMPMCSLRTPRERYFCRSSMDWESTQVSHWRSLASDLLSCSLTWRYPASGLLERMCSMKESGDLPKLTTLNEDPLAVWRAHENAHEQRLHETLMSVLMASKFHEHIHERPWKLKVSWAFSWALMKIESSMSIFMSAHDWWTIPWAFSWALMIGGQFHEHFYECS